VNLLAEVLSAFGLNTLQASSDPGAAAGAVSGGHPADSARGTSRVGVTIGPAGTRELGVTTATVSRATAATAAATGSTEAVAVTTRSVAAASVATPSIAAAANATPSIATVSVGR
jgi:hypothetical protein